MGLIFSRSYNKPSQIKKVAVSNSVLETASTTPVIKSTVNVLIKNEANGKVSAMVLGLPEYYVESSDRQSALTDLQKLITARPTGVEVISLEIEILKPENPWLQFAGVFKDDPDFDRMQEDIAEYRREKDAELEEYYRQIEDKIKAGESGEKAL
jgi:hypothetical protein